MMATNSRPKPFVKITEQPASKALRFRYECEGRSAGSIPGVNSTPENKTYPCIEVVGYTGRAVVVVSCVTKDSPHRPHPHNLVGKEGCKKGVCTLEINSETMRAVFSNLGIQCVKKKDIETALRAREEIRVDPYKTGFQHRFQPSTIDLNSVRLCFQVFIEGDQRGRFTVPLAPVISDPIFDKKAMSDLVICRLCCCSASVQGNSQLILLCEKVTKEDIAVRFFEEKNGQCVWEAYGDFQHTDVHKQTAIAFKTPRYHNQDITEPAKVFIQLRRPSDGVTSEPLPFEFLPLTADPANLKRKRQATRGDPMPLLLQHQQKNPQVLDHPVNIEQFNRNCTPITTTPPIKVEPRVEAPDQNFGLCYTPLDVNPPPTTTSTNTNQMIQQQPQHQQQYTMRNNYNHWAVNSEHQHQQQQHIEPTVEQFVNTNPFSNWDKFPATIQINSSNPFNSNANRHNHWNLTANNLVSWETMHQQQQHQPQQSPPAVIEHQQQQQLQQQQLPYDDPTIDTNQIANESNENNNNNENVNGTTTVSDLLNNIDHLTRLNAEQQKLCLNIAISSFSSMSISA